jgi:TM2 domain-containing membrane protein YozV
MSVDFDRMAAHLPADQRKQLSRQYRRGAKNETTAFLSGFFLGIFGVHHFYLGEWARGFAHLIIPVAAAVVVLAGTLGWLPSLPVTIIVALLVIAGIIWEIVDLFAIDKNVYGRNLTLAESLIGAGALADNSSLVDAVGRLDNAVTGTASAAAPLTVSAGRITADDVSAAREMAGEHNNAIMEEYDSSTTKYISDDPNATSPGAPGAWSETMATSAAQEPSGEEPSGEDTLDMPAPEYVTHTHTETADTVTDSYQFDRSPDATQPMAIPTATEAEANTWPDHPPLEDAALGAGALLAGAAHDGEPADSANATDGTDAATVSPDEQPTGDIAGFAPLAVDASTTLRDTTDAHPHVHHSGLVADTEVNPTHPVYVSLPDEGAAAEAGMGGDAALGAGILGAGALGAGAAYPASQAQEQSPTEETVPEATPEAMPEAAPTSGPLMKRIRMKRQIVVDGQVVREEVVEQLVPIDSDTKEAVAAMDIQLGHATKEEIAHMANLDPDTSLDLRQRYDAPPQTGEPPAE